MEKACAWIIMAINRHVARIYIRGGHDDGVTEGPERGAEARSAGVPRGVGSGEGCRSPSPPPQYGAWGHSPQKFF